MASKQPEYTAAFDTEHKAMDRCKMKNRANRIPGWLFVVIVSPSGDYWCVDIRTAQDLGEHSYKWEA